MTVTVYVDKAGLHRWTWQAGNNRIIADSAQGYVEPRNCWAIATRLAEGVGATLIDRTQV